MNTLMVPSETVRLHFSNRNTTATPASGKWNEEKEVNVGALQTHSYRARLTMSSGWPACRLHTGHHHMVRGTLFIRIAKICIIMFSLVCSNQKDSFCALLGHCPLSIYQSTLMVADVWGWCQYHIWSEVCLSVVLTFSVWCSSILKFRWAWKESYSLEPRLSVLDFVSQLYLWFFSKAARQNPERKAWIRG